MWSELDLEQIAADENTRRGVYSAEKTEKIVVMERLYLYKISCFRVGLRHCGKGLKSTICGSPCLRNTPLPVSYTAMSLHGPYKLE